MNWDTLLLLLFIVGVRGDFDRTGSFEQLRNIVQPGRKSVLKRVLDHRRNLEPIDDGTNIADPGEAVQAPEPEQLPESEPLVPGHTLIQPETNMLQSAVKFPQDSMKNAVYGNMDHLSITYGKTPDRILYTGFRKTNSLLDLTIRQSIRNIQLYNQYNGYDKDAEVIIIEAIAPNYEKPSLDSLQHETKEELVPDEENTAKEILDESSSIESSKESNLRRHDHRFDFRARDQYLENSTSDDNSSSPSSGESSNYDKNPGNPYTLHKGNYKQNYLWNHFMDGDHMNINPLGPAYTKPGPSGAELFFGRKWWYFNQDDFKPLG